MSSIKPRRGVEESFELLIKCMMQSKHRLIDIGSDMDLTGMQTMMILLLDAPKPMNNFTKVFNCDASNITGIVDGLEQKKLAARFPSDKDRRLKMISLSQKGKDLRSKLLDRLIDSQASVLFELDQSEIDTLIKLLRKITVNT